MGIVNTIDVTAKQLKLVIDLITRFLPNTTVWAFGSRVKFTAKPTSDLDLVAFCTPEQKAKLHNIREAFEESNLPFRVDILDWNAIPQSFKTNIQESYFIMTEHKEMQTSKEWKKYKLGEIAEIKYGKDHKHLANGSIPVYGSGGIMRFADKALYEEESILIPRKGTLSNLFYLNKPFWSVDTMFYTKIKKEANGKFLFYLLKTLNLESMNVGSAVPSLTTEVLNKVEVNLPDLPTQTRIAQILSSLDNKIELTRQTNQTLEQIAQTLFKEWFVNFNFPGATGGMLDSELGQIPKGWRVGKLGDIITIKGGTTPSTKNPEFWNGNLYWTSPRDLSNNNSPFLFDTEKKITEKGLKEIGSGLLPKGTLLLSSRAPIGYLAISNIDVAINQGYIGIICDNDISNYFMLLWLKINMEKVISKANGSTFLEISKSNFKTIEIVIPDKNVLSEFQKIAEPIFEKIKENEIETRTLTQIRNTLLPRLMSGELEV